jgi:hypothetical protein
MSIREAPLAKPLLDFGDAAARPQFGIIVVMSQMFNKSVRAYMAAALKRRASGAEALFPR